jgi:hypothetical protein
MEFAMRHTTWVFVALGLVLGPIGIGCGEDEVPAPIPKKKSDQASAGSTDVAPVGEHRPLFGAEDEGEGDGERSPEDGPLIVSISFSPDPPVATSPFQAVVEVDNPADGPLDLSFEWFVNGNDVMGVWGDTLPQGKVSRGDLVGMSVLVRDVNGKVATERIQGMLVSNATPQITSSLGNSPRLNGFTFRAVDPDGDAVRWRVEGAPTGVSIHPTSGRLTVDTSGVFDEGTYEIEVIATDSLGAEGRMRFGTSLGGAVASHTESVEVQDARFVAQREYTDEEYMHKADELFQRMEGMSPEELEAYLEKSQSAQEAMQAAGATEVPGGDQPSPYDNR